SVFLAMVLILPSSLYPALTIAADSQDHKKEETIKPMPQKWCNLWPAGIPFPEDWFKMCRGY
ncbi:TPA: phage virulence factor PagK family protein, partial [Salmonella enterica subsp. enterica serovar Typhimurium]|nr:phage virulence factor [Salmonella enterica]EAC0726667.1 phage virulence factor [Salmonella enterica subsp. enterica serovar Typhimurium]EBE0953032.1 phage virulence factor [Salmonella enterica subsp. enterica serovar 4,[5],12:i:-]EBP9932484.1 phage virulence factor [Salmonella enterica subsp. enterica]EDE5825475.1 phage virulence factor [Salmonella enterica subsp. enterica serovar Saintpaul]EDN3350126.1 phage virulence factor [Salmonella enterica subsp. enterica serovar Litchfield]EDU2406